MVNKQVRKFTLQVVRKIQLQISTGYHYEARGTASIKKTVMPASG